MNRLTHGPGCVKAPTIWALYFLPIGQTINGTCYTSALDAHLLAFMNIHECTTFQQDSAPCHKSKAVMQWFQTKDVNVLNWPENSPDLNLIKNLWTMIKQKVSRSNPGSLEEQKQIIKEVWCKHIDQSLCKNLSDSMPRRIQNVIKNNGYHTKY